jgi:hypothetical protein
MPVLHMRRNKSGHFIYTRIRDNIITFQLTSKGAQSLLKAGIKEGDRFRRRLLYQLYLSGDAYTHGTGPGQIVPRKIGQMELDFANDPEPETLFPRCSMCGSLVELHLVEVREGNRHFFSLACQPCRTLQAKAIDSSLPIPIVTRGIFDRLLEMIKPKEVDSAALDFKGLLDKAFHEKWANLYEQRMRRTKGHQEALFADDVGQKKLI